MKSRTSVYLTDEERRRIKIAAGYAGLSMTAYIRQCVLWTTENDIEEALAAEAKRGTP